MCGKNPDLFYLLKSAKQSESRSENGLKYDFVRIPTYLPSKKLQKRTNGFLLPLAHWHIFTIFHGIACEPYSVRPDNLMRSTFQPTSIIL